MKFIWMFNAICVAYLIVILIYLGSESFWLNTAILLPNMIGWTLLARN